MIVFNKIQYDARVIRAAESIAEMGLDVKVISCNSSSQYFNEKFQSIVFTSKAKHQLILLDFWYQCLMYLFKYRKDIQLLYLHDYYMPILGWFFSIITGKKWVYDAHELMFYRKDEHHSFRNAFFLLLEKLSIKSASLVVAANEERRKIMSFIYKLRNSISVLNVSTASDTIDNCPYKENVIVYQGAISAERSVDFFIRTHKKLSEKYVLKLIGGGPELNKYVEEVKVKEYKNIVFTGMLNQDDLYAESKKSKVGIITYPLSDLNNYYCSPNKVFEYAKMRIPMIVTKQPFLVHIIDKYKIGEVVNLSKDGQEYIDAVKKIDRNYSSYLLGMDKFLADYSADKELNKLRIAITTILGNENTITD